MQLTLGDPRPTKMAPPGFKSLGMPEIARYEVHGLLLVNKLAKLKPFRFQAGHWPRHFRIRMPSLLVGGITSGDSLSIALSGTVQNGQKKDV